MKGQHWGRTEMKWKWSVQFESMLCKLTEIVSSRETNGSGPEHLLTHSTILADLYIKRRREKKKVILLPVLQSRLCNTHKGSEQLGLTAATVSFWRSFTKSSKMVTCSSEPNRLTNTEHRHYRLPQVFTHSDHTVHSKWCWFTDMSGGVVRVKSYQHLPEKFRETSMVVRIAPCQEEKRKVSFQRWSVDAKPASEVKYESARVVLR